MEGLNVCDADLMVSIHPSKANKVKRAIINQLGSLLFTSLRRKREREMESQEQDPGELIQGDRSLNLSRTHKSSRRTAEV